MILVWRIYICRVKDVIQCVQHILCYDWAADIDLYGVGQFWMEETKLIIGFFFFAIVAGRKKIFSCTVSIIPLKDPSKLFQEISSILLTVNVLLMPIFHFRDWLCNLLYSVILSLTLNVASLLKMLIEAFLLPCPFWCLLWKKTLRLVLYQDERNHEVIMVSDMLRRADKGLFTDIWYLIGTWLFPLTFWLVVWRKNWWRESLLCFAATGNADLTGMGHGAWEMYGPRCTQLDHANVEVCSLHAPLRQGSWSCVVWCSLFQSGRNSYSRLCCHSWKRKTRLVFTVSIIILVSPAHFPDHLI